MIGDDLQLTKIKMCREIGGMDCDYVLDTQNQQLMHTICYLYANLITMDLVTDEGGTKGDRL